MAMAVATSQAVDEIQVYAILWTFFTICVAVLALQLILKIPGYEDFVSDMPPLCLFIHKTTPEHSFKALQSVYGKV